MVTQPHPFHQTKTVESLMQRCALRDGLPNYTQFICILHWHEEEGKKTTLAASVAALVVGNQSKKVSYVLENVRL